MVQAQTPSNSKLAAQVADRTGKITPLAYENHLKTWLCGDHKRNMKKLNALMGSDAQGQKLLIACVQVLQQTPALLECTPESFFLAIMRCAELKLFPGPANECAIVPFRDNDRGVTLAQFMPMYMGLAKLCYQGGFVKQITPGIVLEGDEFSFSKGSHGFLHHRPALEPREGRKRIAYYNFIKTIEGGELFEVMVPEDVDRFKARSRGANSKFSPWNSKHPEDYDWMALKTVFKQNQKMLPRSPELSRAVSYDAESEGASEAKENLFDFTGIIDAEYSTVPPKAPSADGASAPGAEGVRPA